MLSRSPSHNTCADSIAIFIQRDFSTIIFEKLRTTDAEPAVSVGKHCYEYLIGHHALVGKLQVTGNLANGVVFE